MRMIADCEAGVIDRVPTKSYIRFPGNTLNCLTAQGVLERIADALAGLAITPDAVPFTGFPFTGDADKIQAFTHLAAQMNRLAKEQKRTQARTVDTVHERSIFRAGRSGFPIALNVIRLLRHSSISLRSSAVICLFFPVFSFLTMIWPPLWDLLPGLHSATLSSRESTPS